MLALCLGVSAIPLCAQGTSAEKAFRVKYIADGAVYLEGGREAGLAVGQTLAVRRTGTVAPGSGTGEITATRIIAQLDVVSVADSSAVCEIRSSSEPLRVGDMAVLKVGNSEVSSTSAPQQPAESLRGRKYPQVISFGGSDPIEEEERAAVPRPKLPEINRTRGRVGVEYSAIAEHGNPSMQSMEAGLVLRMDMTRIGGSYWNFTGYWRGRFNSLSEPGQPQTLQDLLNRTYHLGLFYNNPNSAWTVGVGRLYIPWATSLDTLDGGYLGRRFGKVTTIGAFAGSTPDPTSWSYNPDRRIGGVFTNFEAGGFDSVRYTGTFGVAYSYIGWHPERAFAFTENGFSFKRYVSIYHSLQFDGPRSINLSGQTTPLDPGVSRSFLTVHFQPIPRLSLDLNHNYFRDIPTFSTQLISTGLLDKLLFQGFSGGARVDLPAKVSLYGNFGKSSVTGDARSSWNQLYGLTLGDFLRTGFRADLRYSKFDSSFGRGNYRAVSISRQIGEGFRWEVQGGLQNYVSVFAPQTNGHFVNSTLDWSLGPHFFFEGTYTWQRGDSLSYDQWTVVLGRRF